jgi:hypothetical protein
MFIVKVGYGQWAYFVGPFETREMALGWILRRMETDPTEVFDVRMLRVP